MSDEKDYLQERIAHDLRNDPGFAETWAPYALMGHLVAERIQLGLSQRDVATKMGVTQPAIARMENSPAGVSLARILAYAAAMGAELVMVSGGAKPRKEASGRSRPIGRGTRAA